MSKKKLQNSFEEFCKQNDFEINHQQLEIINLLDKFFYQKENFLSRIFKKKRKTLFLLIWKGRCRKNDDFKFRLR